MLGRSNLTQAVLEKKEDFIEDEDEDEEDNEEYENEDEESEEDLSLIHIYKAEIPHTGDSSLQIRKYLQKIRGNRAYKRGGA